MVNKPPKDRRAKGTVAVRDARRTREALKLAARQVFAEVGFEGARTQEIADRAGVNKAMISYYFGGKQGLFSEAALADVVEARARFEEAVGSEVSASAKLAAFIGELARLAEAKPVFISFLARELIDGGRHLEPQVEKEFLGFFGLVRQVLEEGIEAGELRAVDPHATHISIVGGLVWFALTEPLRRRLAADGRSPAPSPTWVDYAEHFRELTLRGLARTAEGKAALQPRERTRTEGGTE